MTGGAGGSPITPPGPGLPPRYEVRSSLGKGGMGRVYLCYDSILDASVAVKVLAPQFLEDGEAIEAIRAEARHVFKFHDCSRILRLHNFDQHEGNWYLVMEYAEGGSLDARLKREGRFPEGEARRLGAEVAEALEFAHRRKVLHRDVKPANILLDRALGVKVGDFGIAKLMDGVSAQTQHITGTPVYMAPEQILRLPMDGRTDLYSLGCMLYEFVTGVRPYTGAQAQIFLEKVGPDARVPDLRDADPSIPISADYAAIVRRAMALLPDERFASCAELAAALRAGATPAPGEAAADSGATITRSTGGDLPTALLPGSTAVRAPTMPVKAPAGAPTQPVPAAAPTRSRLPLVLGGVGVLAAAGIAFALFGGGEEPKPAPAPTPSPAPVDVASKEPPKPAPLDPAPKEVPKPPVDPAGKEPAREPAKAPPEPPPKDIPKPPDPAPAPPIEKAPAPPPPPEFAPVVAAPPPAEVLAAQKDAPLPAGFLRTHEGRIWCAKDGAEMLLVPAGKFTMGSDGDEEDERPAREVLLGAFLVDRHEVTVAQFRRFWDAEGGGRPFPDQPMGSTDAHPAAGIEWDLADAYARWAGKALPTEAQWEKAARGADGRRFPWGEKDRPGEYNAVGKADGSLGLAPVTGFPRDLSAHGCLGMAGNVSEWCADWFDAKYYAAAPAEEPAGPDGGEKRSLRGGNFLQKPLLARAALRGASDTVPRKDIRHSFGFRCVRRLP